MNNTPQDHIDAMKAFAEGLMEDPRIKEAYIDDWGRFSNFTLIVVPERWEHSTSNILKGIVRRALKARGEAAHLRQMFAPEFVGNNYRGERMYHCKFWKFDVDFLHYDQSSNTFPSASMSELAEQPLASLTD